jgi:DNA-binding PadR family transcriptional regulator
MTNAEMAVLGLVIEQPRHGYQIEQVIEQRGMRRWTEIGFSSIYFLLKKLERQQLIKGEWEKTEHGKERWAKVYCPTDAGLEAFHAAVIEALSVPQLSHRHVMLGLANLPAVTPTEAIAALDQYSQSLKAKMEILRAALDNKQHSHPYFVDAMFERSLAVMQAELEWAERFIAQVHTQSQTEQEKTI